MSFQPMREWPGNLSDHTLQVLWEPLSWPKEEHQRKEKSAHWSGDEGIQQTQRPNLGISKELERGFDQTDKVLTPLGTGPGAGDTTDLVPAVRGLSKDGYHQFFSPPCMFIPLLY